MRDIYTESVIPAPAKPVFGILKYVFGTLTALSFAAIGFFGLPGLIPTALFGFLTYRVLQKGGGEYEYVHTNNCFDVDLIISNSTRKNLVSVNLDHALLIAPADSDAMDAYSGIPEADYSGTGNAPIYAMVFSHDGKRRKILLRMDDNMRRSLKQWMPGKVK